ncbi:MAG TPA: dTMP kinase [Burkholderiales bacterium]|nr:dTMP kinase [Burkholderiales bacterium]
MSRGKFITLEGLDGAGKSTQLGWLESYLVARGLRVLMTREPGGTALGEKIRALLLDHTQVMHPDTEVMLMFAARREHLDKVILPALAAGTWVVSDRFTDASFAYQGGGRGVDWKRLETLENWVQQGLQPDLTLLLDVPAEVGKQRLSAIREPDRFEREQIDFFARVRAGYLRRAREAPQRIRIIDSSQDVSRVQDELEKIISSIC